MPLQVCSLDSAFSLLTKSTYLPALPFLISQRYPSFDSIMMNNKKMNRYMPPPKLCESTQGRDRR